MSRNKKKTYEGSEHELRAQTLELDELHHDVGMPAMAEALAQMRGTSRRTATVTHAPGGIPSAARAFARSPGRNRPVSTPGAITTTSHGTTP